MKKYRIRESKNLNTNESKFYIEIPVLFGLFWINGLMYNDCFKSLKDAQKQAEHLYGKRGTYIYM